MGEVREDRKKELIEKTVQEFKQLNGDNQMFILGYMLGIQQERQVKSQMTAQEGKLRGVLIGKDKKANMWIAAEANSIEHGERAFRRFKSSFA